MSEGHESRVDRLRERAEREFAPAWRYHESGDEIAGELVRYERGTSAYGERIIAILRGPEGGERAVWLHETVLLDEFRRQRPQPGEFLLIQYLGPKESASGGRYQHFRVAVDRPDEADPDWDAVEPHAGDEAPAPPPQAPSVHEPLPESESPTPTSDDDIPF